MTVLSELATLTIVLDIFIMESLQQISSPKSNASKEKSSISSFFSLPDMKGETFPLVGIDVSSIEDFPSNAAAKT
jgi:hypothetical protein